MATLYTALGQEQLNAEGDASKRVALNERVYGVLHRSRARIVFTAALVAADVINIVKLPQGAVVIPHLCVAKTLGTTAAVDLDIGHAGDTDAFANGLNLGTAAEITSFNAGATALGLEAQTPVPFTAPTWVQALVNANSAVVAAEQIEFEIVFAMRA